MAYGETSTPPWNASSEATFTIAPLPCGTKPRPGRAREREHAVEVDVQHALGLLGADVEHGAARDDAGRVDEDVEPPEGGGGRLDRALAGVGVGLLEVELDECAAAAERLDAARVSAGSRRSMWTMSQPASASAMAAVCPMPRVVPVTQATGRRGGSGRGLRASGEATIGPVAQLSLEPVTWRVRALAAGGRTIADSRSALLVLSDDAPPAYAFPRRRRRPTRCPRAAWLPPRRPATCCSTTRRRRVPPRGGRAASLGHPRSPYHRVDALAGSRHVRVTLAGETLAESNRPLALFETGEPTRFYFAQADVRLDLLEPSETTTTSPYLGSAVWFSARIGGSPPSRRSLDVPLPDPPATAHRQACWRSRTAS